MLSKKRKREEGETDRRRERCRGGREKKRSRVRGGGEGKGRRRGKTRREKERDLVRREKADTADVAGERNAAGISGRKLGGRVRRRGSGAKGAWRTARGG